MITIDGSFGEGGGQILRSSLALSMVTGQPFRITNIRANRKRPGLMRQHVAGVHAAQAISNANVVGDSIGSREVHFYPQQVQGGNYTFSVGSAGSATLVLQTVLPALVLASAPSHLTLEGGTHNPLAPPFEFLERAYLPTLNRMGPKVNAQLYKPGFYPAGGGRFQVHIEPAKRLETIELINRGELLHRSGKAVVANLARHIAEREVRTMKNKLNWPEDCFHLEELKNADGPGNYVSIELAYENITEVFTAFGEIKKRAEQVAREAVQQCQVYEASGAPAGEYLTDQLLLPIALVGSGKFHSNGLSGHAMTQIELIRQFLDVEVTVEPKSRHEVLVVIE